MHAYRSPARVPDQQVAKCVGGCLNRSLSVLGAAR